MNRSKLFVCIPLALCVGLAGCAKALDSAIDRAATVTGERVGERVGDAVGTAIGGYAERSLRNMSPALMQVYVANIFNGVYHQGGYDFGYHEYQPGEYTSWKAVGMAEGDEFSKGFLKRLDDGKEWWQITSTAVREGEEEVVVLEALFSAPDESGMRTLLRLRSLFPGDEAPAEMPVQEDTGAYYHEPIKITQESLKSATTGIVAVTTPAGTFDASHVAYRDIRGMAEWWLSELVPGGLVKYQITSSEADEEGEKQQYTVELTSMGRDASTRLGSF